MKSKFFHPSIIWLGVWLAIFFAMALIASWQNHLYWRASLAKSGDQELTAVEQVLPYALAYLAERQPESLSALIKTDLGPYALVLTDQGGKVRYVSPSLKFGPSEADFLKGQSYYNLFSKPTAGKSLSGPFLDANRAPAPPEAGEVWGRLYLIPKETYSFKASLELAYLKLFSPFDSFLAFTLLSYLMVLVGFAAICAISARFQSHFQKVEEQYYESELETRELRIRVLESSIEAKDLRLELLDRSHEKAHGSLEAAQATIADLEKAIEHEAHINEELREALRQAAAERAEALEAVQAIEQDQEKIAKELKELEVLKEVEEMNRPEPSKARRPKDFPWVNLVYQNLSFSRRALQNILDLQNSPDIFPSLPDALATLNNSSAELLANGGTFPSRSVVKYTQTLAHHNGDFWEYRFSKDGRIFFGLSQTKTWNIDTILLKRKFTENRYKYEKYLQQTLGKDNSDLKPGN